MKSDDHTDSKHTLDGQEQSSEVSQVLDRNINALLSRRRQEAAQLRYQDRIARLISHFAGSMSFVYAHLLLFGSWIAANVGWIPFVQPFDPSLVILAMAASVEAIFLSTFVMINQNRMANEEDKRAELSLQISLLSEHETTKLISMVSAITKHFNIPIEVEEREIEELKRNVPPETVLEEIERVRGTTDGADED